MGAQDYKQQMYLCVAEVVAYERIGQPTKKQMLQFLSAETNGLIKRTCGMYVSSICFAVKMVTRTTQPLPLTWS